MPGPSVRASRRALASAGPGGRHQAVVDALVPHGLTEPVALAVLQLGRELRSRTIKDTKARRREYAGMLDAQTGAPLGPLIRGQRNGVDIMPHVRAASGHQAVSVHTHPRSSSFSPDDASLLVSAPGVQTVVAVGADDTWYVLSRTSGAPSPSAATVAASYFTTRQALVAKYRALVQAQTVTRDRAWQEHTHEVWARISPALGLRYDRIEVRP
jgi:hypothetical protein